MAQASGRRPGSSGWPTRRRICSRRFPTTFIESAGTQIKLALRVARRYGCVLESTLPMDGTLSSLSTEAFYARAARYRIASYKFPPRSEEWKHGL